MSIVGYCYTEHVVFSEAVQFVNIAEKFVMFHATTGHVNSPINLRDGSEFINSPEGYLQEVISHFACWGGPEDSSRAFLIAKQSRNTFKKGIFKRKSILHKTSVKSFKKLKR